MLPLFRTVVIVVLVCNRVSTFENPAIECICSDLMVCKKRWIVFSANRPPESSNLELFFRELSFSLNSALDRYDNIIIMGDINIDTHDIQHSGYTKLISFCDIYGLSNLVKDKTCFSKGHSSSIDILHTNKPGFFQNTAFPEIVDKRAPLETRVQRGNTAPFMNQHLQKAIYARSRLTKSLIKILPLKIE